MPNTSDDEQPRRPKRAPAPSARVTCVDNAAELELTSHRQAKAATLPVRPPHGEKRKTLDLDSFSSNERDSEPENRPKKKVVKGEFQFLNDRGFFLPFSRQRSRCYAARTPTTAIGDSRPRHRV